jgi:DNA-binding NarL/FixJ family response regulator
VISGLEQALKRIEDNTIAVLKLLITGKTVEQIADELTISQEKVAEIKKKFEAD